MQKFIAVFTIVGLMSICLIDIPKANSNPVNKVSEYRDLITALREDIRDTKIVDKFSINLGEKFRLVIPNKCEKEGEFELHQLASNESVEESYILIPMLCLWIEVGYNEKRESVQLDSHFIDALLKQYPSLIFYHIQPGNLPDLENYFPGYKDLITLVLINANSICKHNVQITHRVITRLGTMEYGFSNQQRVKNFINKLREKGLRGYEAQNLAYEYMRPKHRDSYYFLVRNCNSHSGTIQQKIIACTPIQTEVFILTFRPITAAIVCRQSSPCPPSK